MREWGKNMQNRFEKLRTAKAAWNNGKRSPSPLPSPLGVRLVWWKKSGAEIRSGISRMDGRIIQIYPLSVSCNGLITRHCSLRPAFIHHEFLRCIGMKTPRTSNLASQKGPCFRLFTGISGYFRLFLVGGWRKMVRDFPEKMGSSHLFPAFPSCKWLISRDVIKFPAFSRINFFRCNGMKTRCKTGGRTRNQTSQSTFENDHDAVISEEFLAADVHVTV